MTLETYGFKRIADKYEMMLRESPWKVIKEKHFHVEQLKMSIDAADEILNMLCEEIDDWNDTKVEVDAVDDADTLWKKLHWFLMKKYVNYRLFKVSNEFAGISKQRERLIECMKSLCPMYGK